MCFVQKYFYCWNSSVGISTELTNYSEFSSFADSIILFCVTYCNPSKSVKLISNPKDRIVLLIDKWTTIWWQKSVIETFCSLGFCLSTENNPDSEEQVISWKSVAAISLSKIAYQFTSIFFVSWEYFPKGIAHKRL